MISTCSSVPADAPLAPTASALHRLHRGVCLLETGSSGIRRHVWHLSKTKFEQIKDGVAGAGARGPAAEGAPRRGRRRVGAPQSWGAVDLGCPGATDTARAGAALKRSSRPLAAFVPTPVTGAVRGGASEALPGPWLISGPRGARRLRGVRVEPPGVGRLPAKAAPGGDSRAQLR